MFKTWLVLVVLAGCGRIGFAPEPGMSIDRDHDHAMTSSSLEVAAGMNHACALSEDTLYCWGGNANGQVGVGTTSDVASPTVVGGGWDAITAGKLHTCGLRAGELWCWGENSAGQLGLGTADTNPHPVPARVGDDAEWIAISAGRYHTCGIRSDTTLWCWGHNDEHNLGLGDRLNRTVPTQVGGTEWSAIRIGGGYGGVAQRADGSTWVWGENSRGELGVGDTSERFVPMEADRAWLDVLGGIFVTCGLDFDRSLWCWGRNDHGELGQGDLVDRWTPMPTSTRSWSVISPTDAFFTCAIDSDSALYCWGANDYGGLGVGDTVGRNMPAQVASMPSGWTAVAGGGGGTDNFACGVNDEQLYCWGVNYYGQLGIGSVDNAAHPVPQPVVL